MTNTNSRRKAIFPGALLLSAIVLLLAIGSVIYHYVEHMGWLDGLFFSVVTATSVGYGNRAPHTTFGKIFTILYIFTSILIVFSFVNHFSQRTRGDNLLERFFSPKDKR